jgi:hypothetical protein
MACKFGQTYTRQTGCPESRVKNHHQHSPLGQPDKCVVAQHRFNQPKNTNSENGLILNRSCRPLIPTFRHRLPPTAELTSSMSFQKSLPYTFPDILVDTSRCPPSQKTIPPVLLSTIHTIGLSRPQQHTLTKVFAARPLLSGADGIQATQWPTRPAAVWTSDSVDGHMFC